MTLISDIGRGEIVGICGLLGAGKTELAEALFGLRRCDEGSVSIDGRERRIRNPIDAIEAGLGFVTESRLADGIFALMSVRENASVTIFDQLTTGWASLIRRNSDGVSMRSRPPSGSNRRDWTN